MKDATLHCPICRAEKRENKRYPRYVCSACAAKVEDEAGRRLEITNANSGDGIRIVYAATGEVRSSRECFVQSIRCWAQEAHFGGVVIQPCDETGKTA
jgi:hypothetical protein